jgi:excisionase family DNA binding protein
MSDGSPAPEGIMENDWLDAEETARSLHITKATLYKLIRDGHVPAEKIGGRWRFTRASIEALFAGAGASADWRSGRDHE